MTFNLTNFYVQTGATRSDILPSVVSFEAHVGVVPDPGSMTAKMVYPTLDTAGSAVTIAKGMTIWMYYYQATPTLDDCVPFAGVITNVEQTGEYIIVTAESLLAPIMRGTFTADYSSAEYVYEIFNDALAAFTPVEPYLISGSYTVYRAATGGAQVPNDVQLDDISFTGETLLQIAQYFSEILINTGLTSNLSTVYPTYYTDPGTGKASVYLTYTGYGNHALTAVEIDHDAGILSSVDWADATDTIINDVTVTIKGGAEYQKTDAASIAAYGQRETKLFRPMYYTNTTYAQKHADTMVAALKSPMSRCFATIEQDFVLAWGSVNGVYTVTDAISGKSEEMVLRSFTLRYPNSVCDCDFDNAALNLANYGIRLENRVSNLESNLVTAHSGFYDLQGGQAGQYYHLNQSAYNNLYQQNQAVKTTNSPTFAALNTGGDVSAGGLLIAGGGLRINSTSYGRLTVKDQFRVYDSNSLSEWQLADIVTAQHLIYGTTQHQSADLFLYRSADVNGWDHWLYWNRYGAVGASTPNWRLGRTGAQEPLRFQYTADDANFSDVLVANVDKSITVPYVLNATGQANLNGGAAITGNLVLNGVNQYGNVYAAEMPVMFSTSGNFTCATGAWRKARQITIGEPLVGSVKLKFGVYGTGDFQYEFRRNGTSLGFTSNYIAMNTTTVIYYTYAVLGINWSIGDTIELWVYTSSGTGYFREWQIGYVRQPSAISSWS